MIELEAMLRAAKLAGAGITQTDRFHGAKTQSVAAASGNQAPPAEVPAGLQKLASVWTAPMPRYAPPILKSAQLGYILSAMVGTGLIVLAFLGGAWIFTRFRS